MHAKGIDPGETSTSSSLFKVSMLTSAQDENVVFPVCAISELNPFTLSDFGLHARLPTLKVKSYLSSSKGLLPGGWLGLPGRASHPLVYTTLLGRIRPSAVHCLFSRWLSADVC
jgi:hypothetical protein